MNTRAKRLALPLGGALIASTVVGASLATTAEAAPKAATHNMASASNAKLVSGNWTTARLAQAKNFLEDSSVVGKLRTAKKATADGKPGIVAPDTSARTAGKSKNVNLPTTVGRVFFEVDGQPYYCSGSVVESKYRNLVATAGHCAYDTDANKPVQNFVFIPGYYQKKAPWGIYVGAKMSMHHDFDVYEDYDRDYAFVNVFNGIKQTGEKEVVKSVYDAHKGFKFTVDKQITQKEYDAGIDKYGENGPFRTETVDQTPETVNPPSDHEDRAYRTPEGKGGIKLVGVEVTEATYKAAPGGHANGSKYHNLSDEKTAISQEQYQQYLKDKGDGNFLGKLEAVLDANKNEIAWFKTQYYVKKWVKSSSKVTYWQSRFFIKIFADAGKLQDNVGGQGFAWNQPVGKKVFAFGYPTAAHPDGDRPYSGETMKWCYGPTVAAPVAAKFKAEEQVAIKCAFTGGSSGGPFLLQYKSSKRVGYLNGVVSLAVDSDNNQRFDHTTSPYFDSETAGVYKSAANLSTGSIAG